MKRSKSKLLLIPFLLVSGALSADQPQNQDKCDQTDERALVMSGGGAKGGFEAGSVYHLVIHRGCDFKDIAGVSVGALNGAYLAQAPRGPQSLENLQKKATQLRDFWLGIKGPQDVLDPRFLGELRLFLFGLDSLNDLSPLEKIIETQIDIDAIRKNGRALRVGTTSFYSGIYREFDPKDTTDDQMRKAILASASIPVYARLPKLEVKGSLEQYADGGVSHITPLPAYFAPCDFSPQIAADVMAQAGPGRPCVTYELTGHTPRIKELFVIVASPYNPASARLPPPTPCEKRPKPCLLDDGREILTRTLDVLTTSPYRWDLNFALAANRMLQWRQDIYKWGRDNLPPDQAERLTGAVRDLEIATEFPVRSANPSPDNRLSLPYEMTIISPSKSYADTYGFDPDNIKFQLYKGCVMADWSLKCERGMTSMRDACKREFPVKNEDLQNDPDPTVCDMPGVMR